MYIDYSIDCTRQSNCTHDGTDGGEGRVTFFVRTTGLSGLLTESHLYASFLCHTSEYLQNKRLSILAPGKISSARLLISAMVMNLSDLECSFQSLASARWPCYCRWDSLRHPVLFGCDVRRLSIAVGSAPICPWPDAKEPGSAGLFREPASGRCWRRALVEMAGIEPASKEFDQDHTTSL